MEADEITCFHPAEAVAESKSATDYDHQQTATKWNCEAFLDPWTPPPLSPF
jgi:hypothetical protein